MSDPPAKLRLCRKLLIQMYRIKIPRKLRKRPNKRIRNLTRPGKRISKF